VKQGCKIVERELVQMQNNVRILSEHEIKKEDNESKRPSKRKK
jgi:hypothetical protein